MAELKSSLGNSTVPSVVEETQTAARGVIEEVDSDNDAVPPAAQPDPEVPGEPASRSVRKRPAAKPKVEVATASGRQTAFWLDDEDRAILHEMGMQLYSQGIKPSHNLVVRAALRMLPKDHRFFEQVRELTERDGRKLRHK